MKSEAPKNIQKLRKIFAQAKSEEEGLGDFICSVDGDHLQVFVSPSTGETVIRVPCSEEGDYIFITVDNPTIKRWKSECLEGKQIMRRAASGERGTDCQKFSENYIQ